jgi:hypothetical protein
MSQKSGPPGNFTAHPAQRWHYMLPESKNTSLRELLVLVAPNAAGWAQGKCPFHDDCGARFAST